LPEKPFNVFACRIRRLWTGQYWQYRNEREMCQDFRRLVFVGEVPFFLAVLRRVLVNPSLA
jgi:hypothetical protein